MRHKVPPRRNSRIAEAEPTCSDAPTVPETSNPGRFKADNNASRRTTLMVVVASVPTTAPRAVACWLRSDDRERPRAIPPAIAGDQSPVRLTIQRATETPRMNPTTRPMMIQLLQPVRVCRRGATMKGRKTPLSSMRRFEKPRPENQCVATLPSKGPRKMASIRAKLIDARLELKMFPPDANRDRPKPDQPGLEKCQLLGLSPGIHSLESRGSRSEWRGSFRVQGRAISPPLQDK